MRRCVAGAICVALVALAGCGQERSGGEPPPRAQERSGGEAPPRDLGGAWREPNADRANSRHVGGPIDASSVGRLKLAWTRDIGSYVATPVVVGGVAYLQELSSSVYAIDATTGAVRWKTVYDEPTIGPNGVAVSDGRVFGATATRVFALDARDGRELWSRKIAFRQGEGTDMAPGVDDGVVYVSTVPVTTQETYAGGVRGILWALDAATGRTRWKWATVPADLWGDREENSGGGLWHPPAFDGKGGVYAATANPAPFSESGKLAWGRSRPGPNKWTNSIVKLDARTGRLVWGRQLLAHDVYDWDLECPPILRRAGGRRIVVVGGKMGIVYALDRRSGELLWRRPVGKHNGHDDDNLRAMRGERLPSGDRRWRLLPGVFGGIESQMAADDDTVYVPVLNHWTELTGGVMVRHQPFEEATGEIVALSLADGRVRWIRRLPHSVFGAATVVNDLIVTTTYDGTLWALARDDGRPVWSARLPSETTAPVAVAGDTVIAAATAGYDNPTTIVAYRLED